MGISTYDPSFQIRVASDRHHPQRRDTVMPRTASLPALAIDILPLLIS
jgi:hypothetical protein